MRPVCFKPAISVHLTLLSLQETYRILTQACAQLEDLLIYNFVTQHIRDWMQMSCEHGSTLDLPGDMFRYGVGDSQSL